MLERANISFVKEVWEVDIMKKQLLGALLLAGVLAAGGTASAAAQQDAQPAAAAVAGETLDGGWQVTQGRIKLDKHTRTVFNKAVDGLLGCDYEPVALLGTQVVAGTNYCVLCRLTTVVPYAKPHWGLAYIYENLQGNVKLLKVDDLPLGA